MLAGFEKRSFTYSVADDSSFTHDVYERGTGPTVVLLQELPGISDDTLVFCDKMVDAGFRVVMPHLFGPLGKFKLVGNMARLFCVRREVNLFAKNEASPVVEWLKALCRDVVAREETSGVGVIGMCMSGNFAISLMADESVLASVASQPSLPMFAQSALHMSGDDVRAVRVRLDQHGPMHAYRFEEDKLCKAEKFEAIDQAFNDDQERIALTTIPGNKHSLLTSHFIEGENSPTQEVLDEIIEYLHSKLD